MKKFLKYLSLSLVSFVGVFGFIFLVNAKNLDINRAVLLKKSGNHIDTVGNTTFGNPNNLKDAYFNNVVANQGNFGQVQIDAVGGNGDLTVTGTLFANGEISTNSGSLKISPFSNCTIFGGTASSTICGDGSVSTIGANLDVEGDLSVSNTLFTDINDQRVGIGTSSPSVPLEVVGATTPNIGAVFRTPDNDNHIVKVIGGEGKNAVFSLANQSGANWNFGLDGLSNPSRFLVFDAENGNFPFSIQEGAGNNMIWIDQNSQIGLGTDSPTSFLTVNGDANFNGDHHFYAEMSTSSNATATTINTQDTFEEINVYEAGITRGATFSNSNITVNTTGTYKVEGSFTMQSGGGDSDTYNIGVFVNGSQITDNKFPCKTSVPNTGNDHCSGQSGLELNAGDVVDVRIENTSDTSDVTIQQSNVFLTQL